MDDLLAAAEESGFPITLEQLHEVVRTNDKQRFALSEDGTKIRANQGHSTQVEMDFKVAHHICAMRTTQ